MHHHRSVLGIDSAKRVLHVVGMDQRGPIVLRKRLSRPAWRPCIATLPRVLIGLEACGGAHAWARRCRAPRHEGKRLAPQCVTPSVKANTNAMRDADGMGDAVTQPPRRFVPTQAGDQQDSHAFQRVRERLRGARTALGHERPGLRHAEGIGVPQGVAKLRQTVVSQREAAKAQRTSLSPAMCGNRVDAFAVLAPPLASDPEHLAPVATRPPACQRLLPLPGLGPCPAPALVAAGSAARACTNGRQGAAWLGLGPRPPAPGGQERWRGISTRGDSALRTLLVPGARTTLHWGGRTTDRRRQGMRHLGARRGTHRTAGAGAHKQARRVGALVTRHQASPLATGSGQPLEVSRGSVSTAQDHTRGRVRAVHGSLAWEVPEGVLPHDARWERVADTRGQTGCLPPCSGTGPVRPRACAGEEAQIASGPADHRRSAPRGRL